MMKRKGKEEGRPEEKKWLLREYNEDVNDNLRYQRRKNGGRREQLSDKTMHNLEKRIYRSS